MRKGQKKTDAFAFVRAWQTSSTVKEVKKKTGLSFTAIRFRAHLYKRHGVPLKKMIHGNDDAGAHWEELIDYAKALDKSLRDN